MIGIETSYDEFETQVAHLMEHRPDMDTGRVWMRHLSIVRPDLHEQLDGRFIDPRRHRSKMGAARQYVEERW